MLGDIPLVGNLFRRVQLDKTKTELLIFLTPHVAARADVLEGMGKAEVKNTKLVPGLGRSGNVPAAHGRHGRRCWRDHLASRSRHAGQSIREGALA